MSDPMEAKLTNDFLAAWPEIQKSGNLHGWMGIGWAAWQAALVTADRSRNDAPSYNDGYGDACSEPCPNCGHVKGEKLDSGVAK